jgi:hypothetical protein
MTECDAPTDIIFPLCIFGNTWPGQKVPGMSLEGAVRRHRAA